jgi:hypothetical protein
MGDEMDKLDKTRILGIISIVLIAVSLIMAVLLWFYDELIFSEPLISDAITYSSIGFLVSFFGFFGGLTAYKKMELNRIGNILYLIGVWIGGAIMLLFPCTLCGMVYFATQ